MKTKPWVRQPSQIKKHRLPFDKRPDFAYNLRMRKLAIALIIVCGGLLLSSFSEPLFQQGSYENSLVLAPLYVATIG